MEENKQKKWVIFDLDGTLFDHGHRIHLVKGKVKDFKQYHSLSHLDKVNQTVARALKSYHAAGNHVALMTGRPEECRATTEEKLAENRLPYDILLMRPTDDRIRSRDMKKDWVEKHCGGFGNVVAVYEDKEDVVDMWVKNGVPFVFALQDLGVENSRNRIFLRGKELVAPKGPRPGGGR